MKSLLLCLAICLVLAMVSGIEIQSGKGLMNRPSIDIIGLLQKRFAQGPVKEDVKAVPKYHFSTNPRDPNVLILKGQYICGDKICSLKPGEIPKGCNGMCQYRVM